VVADRLNINIKSPSNLIMLITRKRNNKNINMYVNNWRLEMVKEIKYLGIYFDNQFTFDIHIKNLSV
jgi:hypothetical protein